VRPHRDAVVPDSQQRGARQHGANLGDSALFDNMLTVVAAAAFASRFTAADWTYA
jgi:hypothetical protein